MKNITDILKSWKKEADVSTAIRFYYSSLSGTLTIYTSEIAKFIGYSGELIEKYNKLFKEKCSSFKIVEFIEMEFNR